jgi:hypothetical protein
MVSLPQFFKQRKLKKSYPNWQSDNQRLFEKYPDLNKQQSDVLDYMEREITIQFGMIKKAWLHLIYLFQSERIRRRRCESQPCIRPHNW